MCGQACVLEFMVHVVRSHDESEKDGEGRVPGEDEVHHDPKKQVSLLERNDGCIDEAVIRRE